MQLRNGKETIYNNLDVISNISCSTITASMLYGTASWANNASSASYANYIIPGGNINLSQSYIISVTGSTPPPTFIPASIWWDDNAKTYAISSDHSGVSLQIGQENWIRAYAGEYIPNGSPVYVVDALNSLPIVKLAQADGLGLKYQVVGVATENINSGSIGVLTSQGQIHDVNTDNYPEGIGLFLSHINSGSVITYPPPDPYEKVIVGYVLNSNVSSGIIQVNIVGLPLFNYAYVGMMSSPSITINSTSTTGSTFTIGTGSVNLSTTLNGDGVIKNYQLNSASFSLTSSFIQSNFIVATYNSGSPIYRLVSDKSTVDSSQTTLVYTVLNGVDGNFVYAGWDAPGVLLANKDYLRIQALRGIEREDGCVLGYTASLNSGYITITSGHAWQGVNRMTLLPVNSTSSRVVLVAHSASVWSGSLINEIVYNKYDNGVNLTTLGNNNFGVNWIYRTDVNTDATLVVLGSEYLKLSDAVASQPPSIPTEMPSYSFLTGRIIVQNTNLQSTRIIQVDSTYTSTFTPAGITTHNALFDIQGGISGQYYHLTANEYGNSGSGSFVRTTGSVITGSISNATSASYALSSSYANTASYFSMPITESANAIYYGNERLTMAAQTLNPAGFPNRSDTTLTYDSSSHVVAISGSNFKVYCAGKEYIKNTEGITITSPTKGQVYYIYYDANASLQQSTLEWGFTSGIAMVCTLYIGAGAGNGFISDERHGIIMDSATHEYIHDTIGPRYGSGFTWTTTTASVGKYTISAGEWYDDDTAHNILTTTTSSLMAYYSGSMIVSTTETSSIWNGGTKYYNNVTLGTLVTIGGNVAAYFIYAINGYSNKFITIYGQRIDGNIGNARTNNTPDTLVFGNFPFTEAKLLYRVLVSSTGILETTDYRTAQYAGSTFTPTSHGSLAGLTTDDHQQYLLLAGRTGGQTIVGELTASIYGTSSYAYTASYTTNAVTASYVLTSSIPYELIGVDCGICVDSFQDYDVGPITSLNKGVGWMDVGTAYNCSITTSLGPNGNPEKRLYMPSGSMIIRKFGWGSDWSKIFIGLLWTHNMTASYTASKPTTGPFSLHGIIGTARNDLSNIGPNGIISNFMGGLIACDSQTRIATMTLNNNVYGKTISYHTITPGMSYQTTTKSGSGAFVTYSDQGTVNLNIASTSGSATFRSMAGITITRPVSAIGTYVINVGGPNSTDVLNNISFGTFRNVCSAAGGGNVVNTSNLANTNTTNLNQGCVYTESVNLFDSVQVVWGGAATGSFGTIPTSVSLAGLAVVKYY